MDVSIIFFFKIIFHLQVFFSHHKPELIEKDFPKNVIHKPDVEHFSKKSVSFKDKTKQTLDAIIYCTGKIGFNTLKILFLKNFRLL